MLNEVETLKETIYRIEADFRRTGELPGPHCFHTSTTQEFFRIDNVPHLAPCFFDYLTNPRIVGMAEEAIGGPARLQQSDAHLRRQVAVMLHETVDADHCTHTPIEEDAHSTLLLVPQRPALGLIEQDGEDEGVEGASLGLY